MTPGLLSPCVKYALKSHFINISDTIPNKEKIINEMKRKIIKKEARRALLTQKINIPNNLTDNGITIRDIKKLERANKVPIVL